MALDECRHAPIPVPVPAARSVVTVPAIYFLAGAVRPATPVITAVPTVDV